MEEVRSKIQEGFQINIEQLFQLAWKTVLRNLSSVLLYTSSYLLVGILLFRFGRTGMIILSVLSGPVIAGYYYAFNEERFGGEARISNFFIAFRNPFRFIAAHLITSLIIAAGALLYYIPGIYFLVAYFFTIPFLVNTNYNVWQSMEASRMLITKKFWHFLLLLIIALALNLVGALIFGIGLLVTIPFTYALFHEAYYQIFQEYEFMEEEQEENQNDKQNLNLDMFR
jgi:uncharacterized membrane protein YesL